MTATPATPLFVPEPYWHLHHDTLLEMTTEPVENRIAYIKENKPEGERALRLKLLRPVKGELPAAVVEAGRIAGEAYGAFQGSPSASYKPGTRAHAYGNHYEVCFMHAEEIAALHAAECEPDCPWDGVTIFPRSTT